MDNILRLFPLPVTECPLEGTYLAHDLRQRAKGRSRPYIYANFIASLDGRIAVPAAKGPGLTVPKATTNPHDWRLFQELCAQSDILLTTGRYLRDWAAGKAQEILQIDDPRFADLRLWRLERGLTAYPDIAVISASLDFEIPPVLSAAGRRAILVTTRQADPQRLAGLESQMERVVFAGEDAIRGGLLAERLRELGCRLVCSAAGPRVLHLLAADRVLDRLYHTTAPKLLGGKPYASLLEGPLLEPALELNLHQLFLDPHAFADGSQLFASYDVVES